MHTDIVCSSKPEIQVFFIAMDMVDRIELLKYKYPELISNRVIQELITLSDKLNQINKEGV